MREDPNLIDQGGVLDGIRPLRQNLPHVREVWEQEGGRSHMNWSWIGRLALHPRRLVPGRWMDD